MDVENKNSKTLARALKTNQINLKRLLVAAGYDEDIIITIGNYDEIYAKLSGGNHNPNKNTKKKRKSAKFKTLKSSNENQIEIMIDNLKKQYNSNLKNLEMIDDALARVDKIDGTYMKLSSEVRLLQKTNITLSKQIAELYDFIGSEQSINGKGIDDDFNLK